MEDVAQSVEHRIVAPKVAGSSPVFLPSLRVPKTTTNSVSYPFSSNACFYAPLGPGAD